MDIERISVDGKVLRRQTSWNLEKENRSWRDIPNGKPSYWHEDHIPISQFELDKIPAAGGAMRIFADTLPAKYTAITEDIHLQDIWEPYLRWKVLSLCLSKDGDNQDLGRSQYADQRFTFGIFLARRLILGQTMLVIPES